MLPVPERNKVLAELTDEEINELNYDWKFWARKEQLPPDTKDWFVWLIRSGRGYGKTRTGAETIIEWVRQGFKRLALVGKTKADVRDTMVEVGESAILNISPPWFRPSYEPSKRRLVWPNGAIAMFYSGDEPDQLRGPQHEKAWVDELAKFMYPQETWDNLEFGLRIGSNPQVIVTTTPRPIPLIKTLVKDIRTVDVRGSTFDNKANLSPSYIERMFKKFGGTRLGRQELEGEILEDTTGALWTTKIIEQTRKKEAPILKRIVVAIDPEAVNNDESSETGIVIAGVGNDNHGYILADLSLRASPNTWASAAINGYYNYKADRIVAEVNNGGEMIETILKNIDANIPYQAVHASRGKLTRAEPVSALYEQGRIHHVGTFPELEDQMCTFVPGEKSPDRMDALVWAITALMIEDMIEPEYEEIYENGVANFI